MLTRTNAIDPLALLKAPASDVLGAPKKLCHLPNFTYVPANPVQFAGHFTSLSRPVFVAFCF
jgi:hypothetical protein